MSVSQLWGYKRNKEVTLSWTVSTNSLEKAKSVVEDGLHKGYRGFNVKLGNETAFDFQLCDLVKDMVLDGFLWGDANGGYTPQELLPAISSLAKTGLDLLEQAFPSTAMSAWKEFR